MEKSVARQLLKDLPVKRLKTIEWRTEQPRERRMRNRSKGDLSRREITFQRRKHSRGAVTFPFCWQESVYHASALRRETLSEDQRDEIRAGSSPLEPLHISLFFPLPLSNLFTLRHNARKDEVQTRISDLSGRQKIRSSFRRRTRPERRTSRDNLRDGVPVAQRSRNFHRTNFSHSALLCTRTHRSWLV